MVYRCEELYEAALEVATRVAIGVATSVATKTGLIFEDSVSTYYLRVFTFAVRERCILSIALNLEQVN